MVTKKVVKKAARKIEIVEPDVVFPQIIKPVDQVELKLDEGDPILKLEGKLRQLKLNDARVRLERAKENGNPDAILACMEEIFKLEEGGKA